MLPSINILRRPSHGTAGSKRRKPDPALHAWFITVFLMVFAVQIANAQNAVNNRTEALQLIQKGDNFMSGANWQDALFAYDNAITQDPTFATAYMKKANLLAKIGRRQEAVKLYDRAVQLNPYSEYIYDSRAKLKMLAMDYTGALSDLDKALSINPDDKIRDHKVDDLIAMKAYEQALVEIDTLINSDYKVGYELERKALVQMMMDSTQECEETVEQLLQVNPNSAMAHDILGLLELKEGKYPKALEHLTKAIELDETFALAYYNRGIAFRYLNNNEAAMNDFNKAIEIRQNLAQFYFTRALVSKAEGEMDDALEDYDKALLLNDNFNAAFYNRAYTLKILGEYTSALSDIDEFLFTDPDSPEAWNLKGNAHTLQSDYLRAIDSYTQAINSNPEYAEAFYNRGLVNVLSIRIPDGCTDLEEAERLGYERSSVKLQAFCGY